MELTRTLVSEPPNIIYPESFVARCRERFGVVEILETRLHRLVDLADYERLSGPFRRVDGSIWSWILFSAAVCTRHLCLGHICRACCLAVAFVTEPEKKGGSLFSVLTEMLPHLPRPHAASLGWAAYQWRRVG